MAFKFSQRSKDRMNGLHPDIVSVMELAIERSPIDFTVLEGLRSEERQKHLVKTGASKTMNSRHLTGHAIDVAPMLNGSVSWDWPLYHKLAPVIKQAANELGVDLEWGGDWTTFKDGPHWQLSWVTYPKGDMTPRAYIHDDYDPVRSGQYVQIIADHVPVTRPTSWWADIIAAIKGLFK